MVIWGLEKHCKTSFALIKLSWKCGGSKCCCYWRFLLLQLAQEWSWRMWVKWNMKRLEVRKVAVNLTRTNWNSISFHEGLIQHTLTICRKKVMVVNGNANQYKGVWEKYIRVVLHLSSTTPTTPQSSQILYNATKGNLQTTQDTKPLFSSNVSRKLKRLTSKLLKP